MKEWQGSREAEVSGLAYESRKVGRGSIFRTWKGKKSDGHAFVSEAVERGAVAVVAEKKTVDAVIPRIRVVLQFLPKVVCQAIKPEAAAKMVEALRGVVSDQGTAEGAQVPGYEVAGKTGTAKKASPGRASRKRRSSPGWQAGCRLLTRSGVPMIKVLTIREIEERVLNMNQNRKRGFSMEEFSRFAGIDYRNLKKMVMEGSIPIT